MYNTNLLIISCLLIGCYLRAEIKLHSIPPLLYYRIIGMLHHLKIFSSFFS
nr:MAG TPA: hypothetical protein [Caudoviricetes sp.]